MKKARFAILFLLLALIAACLPATAELPAEITLICLGKDRTHKLIEYVYFDEQDHYGRYQCTHCGYKVIPFSSHEAHSGGTATCTELAVCTLCKHTYGDYAHDLVFHAGQAATCTKDGWKDYYTCTKCGYTTYEVIHATDHKRVQHAGQPATCTENGWEAYETCENCDYTTYVEIPAPGHDYQPKIVKPTCTKGGYTVYTCTRCNDSYTADPVEKLYHWYGEWSPNEDGTHSASCRRKGCRYAAKVDCQKFEFPVNDESLIFCPVCGEVQNGARLEEISEASAKLVTGKRPKGELIARADGNFLSLAFEYAGKVSEAAAQVKITLPADVLNGRKPVLVSLDGAETALPFETAGDKITFTLDFAEAEVPVFLIRLTDEA